MVDYRETRIVKTENDSKSSATPWLALVIGILLVAVVAVFLMNAHGSLSTPGGTVNLNLKSPVQTPVTPAR